MPVKPAYVIVAILFATCAGCGGGGGTSPAAAAPNAAAAPAAPPPAAAPAAPAASAGGIWIAFAGNPSPLQLFIAEDGDVRVTAPPIGGVGPAFGEGAVVVTGNRVQGAYKTRSVQLSPTSAPGGAFDCTLDGTVSTRTSLSATIVCTDAAGSVTTNTWSFFYDSRYEADSSLASMARSYTLPFNTAGNSLTIYGDGTLVGMYHNGPSCTIGGRVSIIDSNFALYRFEVTFSSCSVLRQYEGVTMRGFGTQNLPGQPAGSFLLLLTAVINGRLDSISVMFEPV
jgi:hypothetical protein